MTALRDVDGFISRRESIPLAWVVARGDQFEREWSHSDDAMAMMRVAAHVVVGQRIVLTACEVVRPVLKYIPETERSVLRAFEIAERWARGKASIGEAVEATAAANKSSDIGISGIAMSATMAVFTVSASASAPRLSPAALEYVATTWARLTPVVDAVYENTLYENTRQQSLRRSAAIIRKHITITVPDLVRAGKSGWKP